MTSISIAQHQVNVLTPPSDFLSRDFSRVDHVLDTWSEWLTAPRTSKARARALEARLCRVLQRHSCYSIVRVRMPARGSFARRTALRLHPAVTQTYVFVDPDVPFRTPLYTTESRAQVQREQQVNGPVSILAATRTTPNGQRPHAEGVAAQIERLPALLNSVAQDLRRLLCTQAAQKELDGLAGTVELSTRAVCGREHKVVEIRGSEGEFDLIPAISWTKQRPNSTGSGAGPADMYTPYYKLSASELEQHRVRTCAMCAISDGDIFMHCSMVEAERAHLNSSISPFKQSVVRLAKWWNQTRCLYFGPEDGFALVESRSHMIEVVATEAARLEERRIEDKREQEIPNKESLKPSIGRAFARFLKFLTQFSSLSIVPQGNYYESLHVSVH